MDTTAPSAGGGESAGRTQVRGSTLLLAGQAFAVLANLVTQILIVRYLSKTDFAAFAYALSIAMIGETVASFGLRRGVSRFLPVYEERDDRRRAAGLLFFTVGVVGSIGLAVALIGIGLRSALSEPVAESDAAAVALAILIVLAPVQALESLFDGVFAAFVRPRMILLRRFVYTPLMRLAVALLVVLTTQGATFLAAGYLLTGIVGLVVYGALLVRVLRERHLLAGFRRPLVVPAREVLGFTVPLLTNDVTGALLNAGSVVIIGVLAATDDVASFRAVLPLSLTLTYVLTSFGTLFVPLASRLHTRGETKQLRDLYWQTAAWSAVLSFPVFALSFAFARPLVTFLFGDEYAGSGSVLAALVVGHFVTAAIGPNGSLLAIHAQLRYIVVTNLIAIAMILALMSALVPSFGALGAAIASSATLIAVNVVRQVGLAARTSIGVLDRRVAWLYVFLAALTAALVLLETLFHPPLAIGIGLVAVCTGAAVARSRQALRLGSTFPELLALPGVAQIRRFQEGRRRR
jgi:O-antigen/teichoic acid export membrane protein